MALLYLINAALSLSFFDNAMNSNSTKAGKAYHLDLEYNQGPIDCCCWYMLLIHDFRDWSTLAIWVSVDQWALMIQGSCQSHVCVWRGEGEYSNTPFIYAGALVRVGVLLSRVYCCCPVQYNYSDWSTLNAWVSILIKGEIAVIGQPVATSTSIC